MGEIRDAVQAMYDAEMDRYLAELEAEVGPPTDEDRAEVDRLLAAALERKARREAEGRSDD